MISPRGQKIGIVAVKVMCVWGFVLLYCSVVTVSRKASGKVQACVYTMIAGAVVAARCLVFIHHCFYHVMLYNTSYECSICCGLSQSVCLFVTHSSSVKRKVPDQEVDQRGLAERLCKKTVYVGRAYQI